MSVRDESSITAEIHSSREQESACALKVVSLEELVATGAGGRAPVILTKGVFDILHRGHLHLISYCNELKSYDCKSLLVVAVESDGSVSRRKGARRPINPVTERLAQVAAIPCVDRVLTYNYQDLPDLIRRLRPAFYVKGQDTALAAPPADEVEVRLAVSERNPEVAALIECGVRMIVNIDSGAISTTDLITRILECVRTH